MVAGIYYIAAEAKALPREGGIGSCEFHDCHSEAMGQPAVDSYYPKPCCRFLLSQYLFSQC